MKKINIKICGITKSESIITAAKNNINSLGFASNNLSGPNTCNDQKIKRLIKECNYYNIESVLLTRHQSLSDLIQQIDFTKPKTICCSYFFPKNDLKTLKSIFKKLKIGIGINPKKFNKYYFLSIQSLVDIFYYDLNVYTEKNITTYSLDKYIEQITFLKNLNLPIYVGGGINSKNAKKIVKKISPNGIDVSRGLKDKKNNISLYKLNELQMNLSAA